MTTIPSRTTSRNCSLDTQGRQLLNYLTERLDKWKLGYRPPYCSYKEVLTDLGLRMDDRTYGLALQNQGLNNLNGWCLNKKYPAITGLIVNKDTGEPGGSYFKSWGKTREEKGTWNWWQSQLRDAKAFNWKSPGAPTHQIEHHLMMPKERKRKYHTAGGEGANHIAIKEMIAKDPYILKLDLGPVKKVHVEYRFITGNRSDLLIEYTSGRQAVVEVELRDTDPGCCQAAIYRLLRGMEFTKTMESNSDFIIAVVAALEFTEKSKKLAARYNLQLVEVKLPNHRKSTQKNA